jgi:hypothetical protein
VLAWGDYWPRLSVSWLERGAIVDREIGKELFRLSRSSLISQSLRQRSTAISKKFLSGQTIEELDCVKIVQVEKRPRALSCTEGVAREPLEGDFSAVVYIIQVDENVGPAFVVERINDEGYTAWVEEFLECELQLACKSHLADTELYNETGAVSVGEWCKKCEIKPSVSCTCIGSLCP